MVIMLQLVLCNFLCIENMVKKFFQMAALAFFLVSKD